MMMRYSVPPPRFRPPQVKDGPACAHPSVDPEWFFPINQSIDLDTPSPDETHSINKARRKAARRICAGCPLQQECLEQNLMERFGIWGGLTVTERRALAAERGMIWPEWSSLEDYIDEAAIDQALSGGKPRLTRATRDELIRRMARWGYTGEQIEVIARANTGRVAAARSRMAA